MDRQSAVTFGSAAASSPLAILRTWIFASSNYPWLPQNQPGRPQQSFPEPFPASPYPAYAEPYRPPATPGPPWGGPPPPPGGPPWGGPPPPPSPPPRGGGPGRWIAIGIAAVVVVGLVGFGIFFAVKSDDSSAKGLTTATSLTKLSSIRSPTSTSRRTSSTPRTSSSPQGGGTDQARLISLLPVGIDVSSCKPIDLEGTLARIQCQGSGGPDTPTGAIFALYADQDDLDSAFDGAIKSFDTVACPDGTPSPNPWFYQSDPETPAGNVACSIYKDTPEVTWSKYRDLVLGYTQGNDLKALQDWWLTNG